MIRLDVGLFVFMEFPRLLFIPRGSSQCCPSWNQRLCSWFSSAVFKRFYVDCADVGTGLKRLVLGEIRGLMVTVVFGCFYFWFISLVPP